MYVPIMTKVNMITNDTFEQKNACGKPTCGHFSPDHLYKREKRTLVKEKNENFCGPYTY